MCPRTSVLLAALLVVPVVRAQIDAPTVVASEDSVEQYLETLGLDRLRAVHLEQRLASLEGESRALAATRLATLYGRLLESDKDPMFRREIELRSRALLKLVPPDDVDDLRLTIVKARYFQAERQSQASLLGATTPEDDQGLAREFQAMLSDLRDIAAESRRSIRSLEGKLGSRRSNVDEAALRDELEALRSRVSQAQYYLGWAQVELSRLTGQSRHADRAIEDFGWILGGGGDREPSVDAVAPGLLGYSHVARSALGCARAMALRGDDVNAVRWLDLVVEAGDAVSADVRTQLLAHRIVVLSMAKRWADLQLAIDEAHHPREGEGALLSPLEARLLAVATLSAMSTEMRGPVGDARRSLLEAMAQVALTDLIEQDQLGEVLAIVTRFGTLPIGQRGFIVHYVRAMRAVERAEATQSDAGEPLGSVTESEAVANRYLEAAAVFDLAVNANDAARFDADRGDAAVLWGRCLYIARQFEQAADVFERASNMDASGPSLNEEAAWNLVVALDRGISEGAASLTERRDAASESFLLRFPASDRAAELLVRRAEGGLLPRSEAIEILLAVDSASPLRRSASLMAAGLLFDDYRASKGAARAQAADRFVRTADALRQELLEGGAKPSDDVIVSRQRLARQMLDAAFATEPPSVRVAERLIEELNHEVSKLSDLDPLVGEVQYRELQLAIAASDDAGVEARFADLVRTGGDYLQYAESLLYERANERFRDNPADLQSASDVVQYGQRLLSGLLATAAEESRRGVASSVVRAAVTVHAEQVRRGNEGDSVVRDLAIEIAEELRSASGASPEVLAAHAKLAEHAGKTESALESWRLVLSSLDPGSDAWMEARLESLRVLARVDAARATQVLSQFDLLYSGSLTPDQQRRRDEVRALLSAGAGGPP